MTKAQKSSKQYIMLMAIVLCAAVLVIQLVQRHGTGNRQTENEAKTVMANNSSQSDNGATKLTKSEAALKTFREKHIRLNTKTFEPQSPITKYPVVDELLTYLNMEIPELPEVAYQDIASFYTEVVKERLLYEASYAIVTQSESGQTMVTIEPYAEEGQILRDAAFDYVLEKIQVPKESIQGVEIARIMDKSNYRWGAGRQTITIQYAQGPDQYSIHHVQTTASATSTGASVRDNVVNGNNLSGYEYIISQLPINRNNNH